MDYPIEFVEIKRLFFQNLHKSWMSFATSQLPSHCWDVFWAMNLKRNKLLLLVNKPAQKGRRLDLWKSHTTETGKGKNLLVRKNQVKLTKEAYISNDLLAQNHSLTFILKNKSLLPATSVLSGQLEPMAYNSTPSLDNLICTDYADFVNCGQIWMIFLVQNWLQLLDVSFLETWQQRFSFGAKSYSERVKFPLVHAIEESTGHCSTKHWQWAKIVPYRDTKNFQRQGWITQTGS